ncbi:MAG: glycosyltransferase [Halobacteriaceae archaeon]
MPTPPRVAAFTDTYLPTVNGVTYTVATWRERWAARGDRMAVVYPDSDHVAGTDEYPVRSVAFPFYEGFRFAAPLVPAGVDDDALDVVHAHTPFTMGLAARRLASRRSVPLVASYHTPAAEYAEYLFSGDRPTAAVRRLAARYERWFYASADVVLAPSATAREDLLDRGVDAPVEVVPNGVDLERFRPVDATDFRERHGLDDADRLVGYTGRHGYEKRLCDLVEAAADLDARVVLGGDGPARETLEAMAGPDADVRFLGFLDREEMPAFYSALDVFAFPSPVETQGIVALEANACGTPVVGADAGALADTVRAGETGYRFPAEDPDALRAAVEQALAESEALGESCLDRREEISVERAVDELVRVYDGL